MLFFYFRNIKEVRMQLLLRLLPSIVTLALIGLVGHFYSLVVNKRYKERFNSIEWLETHSWMPGVIIAAPAQYLFGPAVEELVFRLPTIVLADNFPSYKWYFIGVTTLVFSICHWHGTKIDLDELLSINFRREKKLDNLTELIKVVEIEKRDLVIKRKILRVLVACVSGFVFTYFGVAYQSLWLSFILHSMWNLFMPLLVIVFAIVFLALLRLLSKFKDSIYYKRRAF